MIPRAMSGEAHAMLGRHLLAHRGAAGAAGAKLAAGRARPSTGQDRPMKAAMHRIAVPRWVCAVRCGGDLGGRVPALRASHPSYLMNGQARSLSVPRCPHEHKSAVGTAWAAMATVSRTGLWLCCFQQDKLWPGTDEQPTGPLLPPWAINPCTEDTETHQKGWLQRSCCTSSA